MSAVADRGRDAIACEVTTAYRIFSLQATTPREAKPQSVTATRPGTALREYKTMLPRGLNLNGWVPVSWETGTIQHFA